MSYEGYEVFLCANGHQHNDDCYNMPVLCIEEESKFSYKGEEFEVKAWTCPLCEEYAVWWEGIDQTNDRGIRTALMKFAPQKEKTCNCCNHTTVVEEEKYYIPSNRGHRVNMNVALKVPLKKCEEEQG